MKVTLRLPAALRELARGERVVVVGLDEPATVASLLDELARRLPAVERRIRDETGTQRRHVNLFVGEMNVRDGAGLAEPLADGAEVFVIPAVSGGGGCLEVRPAL
jgi:molybdopterin converting factor small subunit